MASFHNKSILCSVFNQLKLPASDWLPESCRNTTAGQRPAGLPEEAIKLVFVH